MTSVQDSLPSRNTAPEIRSVTSSTQIIGTVKGPGETGNQYVFITTNNRQVKIGEFVYYSLISGDRNQKILGKISNISLIDHFPDRIFADPETSPEAIAALVGFTDKNPELYEVTVDVIGYFHRSLGFLNPRQSPDPGAKVMLASDRFLQSIINRKQQGEMGSAHMGSILLRPGGNVPVVLDVKELVSTHLAILAGTGSGKSYTACASILFVSFSAMTRKKWFSRYTRVSLLFCGN
ncbi:MAG TPA: hypothetical protein DD761_03715 [Cyanobacteria bacterium UBA11691]|nr:hypothetical protein [Cyanobacteria bacterium UBA11691]